MSRNKLPNEGARYALGDHDGSSPSGEEGSRFDEMESMDSYFLEAERLRGENQELRSELQGANARLDELEAMREDYEVVRAGRDQSVLALATERDQLAALHREAEEAHGRSKQYNVEWDEAYKKLEGTSKETERKLEREELKYRRVILNHRLAIAGIGVVAALLIWAWASAMSSTGELEDSNTELAGQLETATNRIASLEDALRPTEELRSEITSLTLQRDQANDIINSLRSDLGRANQAAADANARRDRAERRGEMPGGTSAYRQVRSAFLAYINALPNNFSVDAEYVGCVRGRVIDSLDDAYSNNYQRWDGFRDKTKRDFAQCKRYAGSYRERNAIHDRILDDYMYRDGNFLDRIAAQYGS